MTAQAGAINLLEKYTALNRSIDDARRENAHIQSKKESILQQVEKLRSERVDAQTQTAQARQDSVTLNKRVQEELIKCSELEDGHAQSLLDKMEARRQLEFTKQYVEEQRQEFLEKSRDFRTTCKRMRLSASAVGEDVASSKAFLELHDVTVDWSDSDEHVNDLELEQALAQHARRKQERDKAQRALQAAQARENISSKKAAERLERKKQSLAQLDRVRKDNADAENELKDLDQQTREAREMCHNYEQDLIRRRMNSSGQLGRPDSFAPAPSVTPNTMMQRPHQQQQQSHHQPPTNPYASSRSTTSRNSSTGAARNRAAAPRRQQQHSSSRGDSYEAQPHLMSRRRRPFDRQFGSTALDIISGRETEEDDIMPPEMESESIVYKTLHNPTASDLLDSDSEDDDELFGESVFSKK